MKTRLLTFATSFLMLCYAEIATAGDEQWDDQFFVTDGQILSMTFDSRSNLYVGGAFQSIELWRTEHTGPFASWDGRRWSRPGLGIPFSQTVNAVLARGTDVFVGGGFTAAGGIWMTNIALWDGTNWFPVGGGIPGGSVNALALAGNDLYVAGSFANAGGLPVSNIAKWNGSTWSDVSGGVSGYVRALLVVGEDLYVGGRFTRAGGIAATNLARWSGTAWHAIENGPVLERVLSLTASPDGDLFVGGMSVTQPSRHLWRWDGTHWIPILECYWPDNGQVNALLRKGEDLYAAGSFSTNIFSGRFAFAKWGGGTNWIDVGAQFRYQASALVESSTDILVAGQSAFPMSANTYCLARYDGSGWSVTGHGVSGEGVYAVCPDGNGVITGGAFGDRNGLSLVNRWDGQSWTNLGAGIIGPAQQTTVVRTVVKSGEITYIGGAFANYGATGVIGWDSTNYFPVGANAPNNVTALCPLGSQLFAGGYFGGQRWDGTNWLDLNVGHDPYSIAVVGSNVYFGGSFTQAGGVTVNRIACWDGQNWSALGSGLDGTAYAMTAREGKLYVGGDFKHAGGIEARGIACWDGQQWSPLGTGVSGQYYTLAVPGEAVFALAWSPQGILYAGGNFTNVDNCAASSLAQWDGRAWSPLGSGILGHVYALAWHDYKLYVGGIFFRSGGTPAMHFAVWSEAPKLDCALEQAAEGEQMRLSWPLSFAQYGVEASDQPVASGSWVLLTNDVGQAGGRAVTTVPKTAPGQFFRLRKQ